MFVIPNRTMYSKSSFQNNISDLPPPNQPSVKTQCLHPDIMAQAPKMFYQYGEASYLYISSRRTLKRNDEYGRIVPV